MTDDVDWKIPTEPVDEWTWIDDLMFAFRVIMIILTVVASFGFIVWLVLK